MLADDQNTLRADGLLLIQESFLPSSTPPNVFPSMVLLRKALHLIAPSSRWNLEDRGQNIMGVNTSMNASARLLKIRGT